MRGSVLIITIYIMMIMSLLLVTTFSIAQSHFLVSSNDDLHQEAYYLAESGMNYAMEEFRYIARQAFEECIAEFKWDPLKYPLCSVQEAAQSHVKNKLGSKIKNIMNGKGCLAKLPSPVLANVPDNSKVNVLIQFFATENPPRLEISSRGEIGKIRRRIDSEIFINNISGYYNSLLFDKILLSGGSINIKNGGLFETDGSVFLKGNLLISKNSLLKSSSTTVVNGEIYLQDNSIGTFSDDVFCGSVYVDGEPGSHASFLSDLYTYGEASATGESNEILVNGVIYDCNDEESAPEFNDILLKMKTQMNWNYSSQLNPAVDVTNKNIVIDGNSFSILDEDKPFIYITTDEKDIVLPPGNHEGILVTNGSILIEPSRLVEHKGLLIAGKDLFVEGSLKLYKDKDLLLALLSQEDESFRRFFEVEPEAELFEIHFSKEVLFNKQW
ncbi:MAG: hypothetical protein GX815_03495 [Clostridiales bacterium]|nr:hypothetical protein [Clostridiales bacterium]